MCALLAFMRHGKAEPKKPGVSDFERRLTEEGREDVKLVARALPFKPSVIYHSPLKRAVETAEIVSKVTGAPMKEAWGLEPEQASLSSLRDLNPPENAVLVGHAPSLTEIVSTLIGGGRLKLKAGGLAVLDVADLDLGRATLLLLITPDSARRLTGFSLET